MVVIKGLWTKGIFEDMLSDELQIYKDTFKLCKILMSYSKNVSRLVRYGEYSVAISKACTALDLIRRINESFLVNKN